MKLSWDCLMSTECFVPHVYLDLTVPMNESPSQSQPCLAQAFYNSLKLYDVQGHEWDMVKSSDKTWYPGEEKTTHFSILVSRTPWTVWKGKKIWYQKMSPPARKVSSMQLRKSTEIAIERMKRWGQSRNNAQLWMRLVMKLSLILYRIVLHRNLEC